MNIQNISKVKYTANKDNMKIMLMYNDLSDNDKLEVKLWILDYLRRDESFGKEIINQYLDPDIDLYSIIKLSNKNPDGEKFVLKLFRKIIGITLESEIEEKQK